MAKEIMEIVATEVSRELAKKFIETIRQKSVIIESGIGDIVLEGALVLEFINDTSIFDFHDKIINTIEKTYQATFTGGVGKIRINGNEFTLEITESIDFDVPETLEIGDESTDYVPLVKYGFVFVYIKKYTDLRKALRQLWGILSVLSNSFEASAEYDIYIRIYFTRIKESLNQLTDTLKKHISGEMKNNLGYVSKSFEVAPINHPIPSMRILIPKDMPETTIKALSDMLLKHISIVARTKAWLLRK